ncbi:class I SAM-dependent methyltransferase [Frigoribacterium sp. 2-23]|uniref:class I SAM-dependent methyltransferase n=1 Tax=Frigoribacterium sp. 2-23 TaxID=3415006 RepID=UPI003C6FE12A
MTADVTAAYDRRALEYRDRLGTMSAVHPADESLVTTWARAVDGPVIDAGCGPGHWTAHLASHGVDARGVDRVPAFVELARASYPDVPFAVGDLGDLGDASGSVGGLLAWYSLIHHEPSTVPDVLREFGRVLRPGGSLLIGFFTGATLEPFEHAVVTAYRWPMEALADEARRAGFEVVETHTRTGPGYRPHGALVLRAGA